MIVIGLVVSTLLLARLAGLVIAHGLGSLAGVGGTQDPLGTDHAIHAVSSIESPPATTYLHMQFCHRTDAQQADRSTAQLNELHGGGKIYTPSAVNPRAPSDLNRRGTKIELNVMLDVLTSTFSIVSSPLCLLDEAAQPPEAAVVELEIASEWLAIDARGVGCGWNLNLRAVDFEDEKHNVIPAEQLSIHLRDEDIHVLAGNDQPLSLATDPVRLSTKDQRIAFAPPNSGMGTFLLQPTLTLTIPKDTPPGRYHATITLNIISGP